MSPEASTHLIEPETSEDLTGNEPWSVETSADGLMNELFTDIDHILDGSSSLPSQTVKIENIPVPKVAVNLPRMVLPQTVNQPQATPPDDDKPAGALVVQPPVVTAITPTQQPTKGNLVNMLLLGATLGMVMAAIIYLIQSEVFTLFTTNPTQSTIQTPQPPLPMSKDPEAEMVDYMLEALAVIDKQESQKNQTYSRTSYPITPSNFNQFPTAPNLNQTSLNLPSAQPLGNLPPLPMAANNTPPAPTTNRTANVIERIYIPMYSASPLIPGTNIPAAKPTVQPPTQPNNQKVIAAAVQKAPIAIKQPPIKVVPPKLPTPATVPTVSKKEPTLKQEQVYLPASNAELEALLELGKKSAALFKIDGVTRQINLGESIGASGWTLVEVSKGEAIIRRNGEVRSIYAGQKL
jgi:hypothetical protein